MKEIESRRKSLFRIFSSMLAVMFASIGLARAQDAVVPGAGSPASAIPPAATKKLPATLKVIVSASGKPVVNADVLLKSSATEARRFTNPAGEAIFVGPPLGASKVRIIAPGWASMLKDITVKEGAQTVEITLQPPS